MMTVECNNIKCRARWTLEHPERYITQGNRIVAGQMIICPKCNRMDRPYIVDDAEIKNRRVER